MAITTTTAAPTAAVLAAARGGAVAVAALAGVEVATARVEGTETHLWGVELGENDRARAQARRAVALLESAGYVVTDVRPYTTWGTRVEISVRDTVDIREEDGTAYRWVWALAQDVRRGEVVRSRSGERVTVVSGEDVEGAVEHFPVRPLCWEWEAWVQRLRLAELG